MDREAFDELFEQEVAAPLCANYFTQSGKSFYYQDASRQIGLIRGGGRLAQPGAIVHLIAFRPSFARETTDLTIPSKPPKDAEHYPFVFDPKLLPKTGPDDWAFSPDLHWRKPYGVFSYSDIDVTVASDHLGNLRDAILSRWMPWTATMNAKTIIGQLKPHIEKLWIARIWAEDCEIELQSQL